MQIKRNMLVIVTLAAFLAAGSIGCSEKEGIGERTGKALDEAAEEMKEDAKQAGEAIEEAAEEAEEAVKKGAREAEKAIDEVGE